MKDKEGRDCNLRAQIISALGTRAVVFATNWSEAVDSCVVGPQFQESPDPTENWPNLDLENENEANSG